MNQFSIVITGASGFIGQALIGYLSRSSNFFLIPLCRTTDFGFGLLDETLNLPSADILIHLADKSEIYAQQEDSEMKDGHNSLLLEAVLMKNYSSVIYLSSSAVYKPNANFFLDEKSPVQSETNYSKNKLVNEKLVLSENGTILRLANILGRKEKASTLFNDLLGQKEKSGPLIIRDANPIREFLCLFDLLSALEKVINNPQPGIFNLGTGIGYSVLDFVKLFLTEINQTDRQIEQMSSNNKSNRIVMDNSLFMDTYRWRPSTDLHDCIRGLLNE